jgi:hypothetical protein
MITRERHCITNIAQVLFSKDNLDGSVRNHNETMLRGVTMRTSRLTGYGRMEEGMRRGDMCIHQTSTPHNTEQHGIKIRVSDPVSDPDPDPHGSTLI